MPDYTQRRTMMVDTQVRPSDVTKFPIIDAMLAVPRENYVPLALREAAYMGNNVDLGSGRVVLEPRTLAKMLDAMDLQPEELILDIGPGYGYSTAIIASLSEAVVAVEADTVMAKDAETTLAEQGVDNAMIIEGALAEGAAQHGPYDAILLQGGVQVVPPAILAQLKDGGRIGAIFMDGAVGRCSIGYKDEDRINWRFAFNATAPVLPGFDTAPAFTL